jgi:hypothetical protein
VQWADCTITKILPVLRCAEADIISGCPLNNVRFFTEMTKKIVLDMVSDVGVATTVILLFFGITACFVGCRTKKQEVQMALPISTIDIATCPNCEGIGREGDCPICDGKSNILGRICGPCSSSGLLNCIFCNGRGTIPLDSMSLVLWRMDERRAKKAEEEDRKESEKNRAAEERARQDLTRQELAANERERQEFARLEREKIELAKLELAAQERVRAQERARQERERQEQQRIAAEARKEREQIAVNEKKDKWSQLYNEIEIDMSVSTLMTLVNGALGDGDKILFLGINDNLGLIPLNSRNDTLEWRSQKDGPTLSIKVRLWKGKVLEKTKSGF